MLQVFREPKFDFMRWKWLWIGISLVTITFSLIFVPLHGVKQAVEFTGGAEVDLRFVKAPHLDTVRSQLEQAGLPSVSVTTLSDTFAKEQDVGKEIVVRVGLPEQKPGEERDLARKITEALSGPDVRAQRARGLLDLNVADQVTIASRLAKDAGLSPDDSDKAAAALLDFRRQHSGVLEGLPDLKQIPGLAPAVATWAEKNAFVGPFGLRGQQVIEASVSGEMRRKAFGAAGGALLGMLLYIWFRYHFQWGLGAVVALIHDTIFTLGLFSISGYEANLPVVAAFLTLIGYSNNDTVVIFDRIRENMKIRGRANFEQTINDSINQTLSRTVITSFLTWLSVLFLYLFGGPVLRPFAFVLLVGIIVGTYSSIYIASPILTIWLKLFSRKTAEDKREERAAERRAPKSARA